MPWFLKNANIIPTLRCNLLMKQKIGWKKTTFELFNNKYLRGVTSQKVLIASYNHLIVHISRLSPLMLVSLPHFILISSRRPPLLRADHFSLYLGLLIELLSY
jgi:hypothetical protein